MEHKWGCIHSHTCINNPNSSGNLHSHKSAVGIMCNPTVAVKTTVLNADRNIKHPKMTYGQTLDRNALYRKPN